MNQTSLSLSAATLWLAVLCGGSGCRAPVARELTSREPSTEQLLDDTKERGASSSPSATANGQPDAATALFSAVDLLSSTADGGISGDGWYQPLRRSTPDETSTSFRWQHDALEKMNEQPKIDLADALSAEDLTIRATAAIGLARREGAARAVALVPLVAATQLSPAQRCAAAETYLKVADSAAAEAQLVSWLKVYSDQLPFHAELLAAGSERFPTALEPWLAAALESRATEVRGAALQAMHRCSESALPQAIPLLQDSDLAVRVEAINLFGERPLPAATALLCAAAHDANLSIRLAAVAALAEHTDAAAGTTLLEVLRHDGERVRAAAVATLARRGDWAQVQQAASDKSWLVRREVAAACDQWKHEADRATAHALLEDRSMEVRLQLIETLRLWPLEQAGPLLIKAASQRTFAPSQAAQEQLYQRWPRAKLFEEGSPQAEPSSTGWQAVAEAFAAEFGSDGRLLPAEIVPTAVTPQVAALQRVPLEFAWLARLEAAELQQRREGARQLELMSKEQPLSLAALERLVQVAPGENDPLVWRSLLAAIGRNRESAAAQIAYAGLSHPDAETRRRACLYLKEHPHERHVAPLAASLKEADVRVCLAAISAYSASASLEQLEPLAALVKATSHDIQLAAAVELARQEHSAGYSALERLAGHSDPAVRRSAVRSMGQLADPLFLPMLIILLEDRYEVRMAALKALPQVTRCDPATETALAQADTARQCTLWQQWYASGGSETQNGTASRSASGP